ncbi:hypothetical protein N9Y60_05940 [Crocinitomicaceae bacterium]|nr:hypothetical protein [Crocinitomicaceae bacterium]MDB3907262.1 hypothetical protein [Crocinitomicaceae bacterium]
MKSIITLIAVILATTFSSQAQSQTIAVGYPAITGLNVDSKVATKLLRYELIKLDKYSVYDEYDMKEAVAKDPSLQSECLSTNCLIKMGEELTVDYTISGSIDKIGDMIVINLKMIDVKSKKLHKTEMFEFADQENELQRMIAIVLRKMHDIETDAVLADRLKFNNDPVASKSVGKMNNSGPRVGVGMMTGDYREFATRSMNQGGLDIVPTLSMIGYQFEAQYVGTENFSGLFEFLVNINGLEQGQFIPSVTLLNGFRFGKAGWEFAFGPGFSLERRTNGFFDSKGSFANPGTYFSNDDWNEYADRNFQNPTDYPEFYTSGSYIRPTVTDLDADYNMDTRFLDSRGSTHLSTMFVFAFGRTFRAGALNIPVNLFYTSRRGGGLAGINVGFNVTKSKTKLYRQ